MIITVRRPTLIAPAPHRRRTPNRPRHSGIVRPWPGADPKLGPSLFMDQLALWDEITDPRRGRGGPPSGPIFATAGAQVRRIPPTGSKRVIGEFLASNHYTAGPGMRGLAYGLYRGQALLGVAVFSRVCRPRWAAENFALLPADRSRSPDQRRHLSVTEAEYAALSRLAITSTDRDGSPLGKGAASWFLSRCLAGIEARNRALWAAHQRVLRGIPVEAHHLRLLREAAHADVGRGRGYLKGLTTWADPYENMLGRIYQLLAFHYTGRTNRGKWTRERVGLRSCRRLSARTLAKARAPHSRGHANAALRLAWEGGAVSITVATGHTTREHSTEWVRTVRVESTATEPEIASAIDAAWHEWRRDHVPTGASVHLRYECGTGVRVERFPPKHAYFTGLGAPWYRRQTEIRHRPLTERLLAEDTRRRGGRRDRRRDFYPARIPPVELRADLRGAAACPPIDAI